MSLFEHSSLEHGADQDLVTFNRKTIMSWLALVFAIVALSSCVADSGNADQPSVSIPDIPEFPWPPPRASGMHLLPRSMMHVVTDDISLGDVDARITAALAQNGYDDRGYYAVPDGFALVTRLEQIELTGIPKEDPVRWSLDITPLWPFSLGEYIRRLFLGTPGYYRLIVFVVTPRPFSQDGVQVTGEQAMYWLAEGLNRLPVEVAKAPYTDAFATTVLIYEFARPTENDEVKLTNPSSLTGRVHLERSGIWSALQP